MWTPTKNSSECSFNHAEVAGARDAGDPGSSTEGMALSFVEQFRSSSPPRQALAIAVVAAVLTLALAAAYLLVLRKPYGVLFSGLREVDAATIVADLDKKKTPYHLADGGSTILVPRNLVDSTRLAMAGGDLPLKGTVGFELFNKSDMGLTEFAQRINYQRALQGELARTIMTLDSVDSARVHLTIADPTLFRDDRQPSKASITIVPRPGRVLYPNAVVGIQRLVAAAVPDLDANDVVVLDASGLPISNNVTSAAQVSPQDQEKHAIEQYYAARISQALAPLAVAGNAQVTVSAQTGPSPTSITGDPGAIDAWSPASRHFPLAVTVALPALPASAAQDQIRAAAGKAAGLQSARGDAITFSISSPNWGGLSAEPETAGAPAVPATAARNTLPNPAGPSISWLQLVLLFVLLALVTLAVLLRWRFGGPRALSAGQRSNYASRLQELLAEEPDRVSSGG